eukprot:362807-Chlamydomonas_euryale.AAC.12
MHRSHPTPAAALRALVQPHDAPPSTTRVLLHRSASKRGPLLESHCSPGRSRRISAWTFSSRQTVRGRQVYGRVGCSGGGGVTAVEMMVGGRAIYRQRSRRRPFLLRPSTRFLQRPRRCCVAALSADRWRGAAVPLPKAPSKALPKPRSLGDLSPSDRSLQLSGKSTK